MDDIRSRRYKLNKVIINDDISQDYDDVNDESDDEDDDGNDDNDDNHCNDDDVVGASCDASEGEEGSS